MTRRDFGVEAVVEAIRASAGTDHARVVSVPQLCAETGLSDRAVRRAIERAVEAHQLAVEQRGANRVNRYMLVNGARNQAAQNLLRPVATPGRDARARRQGIPTETGGMPSRYARAPRQGVTTAGKCPTGTRELQEGLLCDWGLQTTAEPGAPGASVEQPPPALAPARKAPPNADLWAAVYDCWLGEEQVTRSAASLIGKAAKELAELGATPDQVRERWAELARRYDEPTPAALAKHWPAVARPARTAHRATGTRGAVGTDVERIRTLARRTDA